MSGIQLREVFGFGYTVGIQREEDACFLFSQVQYFKNGIAYPFRSECADMESEGNYRFKVVTSIQQLSDTRMLRLIPYSLKTPLLQRAFSLHGMSGRLLRTGRKVPIRSWRLR